VHKGNGLCMDMCDATRREAAKHGKLILILSNLDSASAARLPLVNAVKSDSADSSCHPTLAGVSRCHYCEYKE
jgi:hypothetical protein